MCVCIVCVCQGVCVSVCVCVEATIFVADVAALSFISLYKKERSFLMVKLTGQNIKELVLRTPSLREKYESG